jgi:hypothetical protein
MVNGRCTISSGLSGQSELPQRAGFRAVSGPADRERIVYTVPKFGRNGGLTTISDGTRRLYPGIDGQNGALELPGSLPADLVLRENPVPTDFVGLSGTRDSMLPA